MALQPPTPPVSYRVDESKPSDSIAIQAVSVKAVAGMDRQAVGKVNAALTSATAGFAKEAKQCAAAAQGHLWGYQVRFDKALLSDNYLSIVFAKTTVCAGSPNEQKEARVFARKSGTPIPARTLFKQMLPAVRIAPAVSKNKELIRLDEDTAEQLIDDERCGFYLKNTSYRIWVDGTHLVLFPEFTQTYSFCQKEYLIHRW